MILRLRINLLITTLILLFMLATGSIIVDNAREYTPGDLMYRSSPSTCQSGRSAPTWFARLVAPCRLRGGPVLGSLCSGKSLKS